MKHGMTASEVDDMMSDPERQYKGSPMPKAFSVYFHSAPQATARQPLDDWRDPHQMDRAVRQAYGPAIWQNMTQFPAFTVVNRAGEWVAGQEGRF